MGRNQLFPLHNQTTAFSTCLSLLGILCFVVEIAVAAVEFQKERCKPISCGNGTIVISYPFWITGLQDSYCGYPSFRVNCNGEVPVLAISDTNYNITGINYDSKTVVVQQDLIYPPGSGSSCVCPSRNLTIENTSFKISHAYGNSSLYFLVNCSNMAQEPPGYFEIRCPGEDNHQKFYVGNHTAENMSDLIGNCSQFLVSPVAKTPGMNISDYARFFNGSIDLNWAASDCDDCSKSGGYCGYNYTSNRVVCLCDDRVHQFKCQKKKVNVPLKVVIDFLI